MLDSIIFVFLLAGLGYGIWKGLPTFLKHAGYFLCFLFTFIIALLAYEPIGKTLSGLIPHRDLSMIIAFDFIFALFFISGLKLNSLIHDKLVEGKIQSTLLEKMLGGLAGFVFTLIGIWLVLIALLSVQVQPQKRVDMLRESGMARTMIYGSGSLQNIMPSRVKKKFLKNYSKIIYEEKTNASKE